MLPFVFPIMLRSGKTLLKKSAFVIGLDSVSSPQNAVCIQPSRGLRPRKPAYSGIAKTKLFRIPKQTVHPPDEAKEMQRIANHYRLYIRSISDYFVQVNRSHAVGSQEAGKEVEKREAEWQDCLMRNKQWNDSIALSRNERLLKERTNKQEEISQRILDEAKQQELRLQAIEEIVRIEKENSKSYITPENIDQAIAEALESKRDFNYAIDLKGYKFVGRYVDATGCEDLPDVEESDEDSLPSLFQSAPVSSS